MPHSKASVTFTIPPSNLVTSYQNHQQLDLCFFELKIFNIILTSHLCPYIKIFIQSQNRTSM